jgi:hypothetical protein
MAHAAFNQRREALFDHDPCRSVAVNGETIDPREVDGLRQLDELLQPSPFSAATRPTNARLINGSAGFGNEKNSK